MMKRSCNRKLALALALLMLLAVGCKKPPAATQTPETVSMATQAPETTATPRPVPDPTPDAGVGERFEALDLEIFRWYAASDGYTYHSLVSDPAKFGIDPAAVPMTLGEFTEEDSARIGLEAKAYLERLNAIPRSALSAAQQLAYDVLQQYLETMADDTDYAYFYEPLTEYSGIHGSLPLMFALFEIESRQDVEDYLTLLSDVPRYLGQVMDYEREKAKLGMFMTSNALDAVLDGCQDIIDSKRNSFLYATFNDALDGVPGLTDQQRADYQSRNETLIKEDFIDAYIDLRDGLKALKGDCRKEEGVCALGKRGTDYFALCMQEEADNQLSVEETLELLKSELTNIYVSVFEIQEKNPAVWDQKVDIGSGDTETDLALLREITGKLLPELPEHTLSVESVPEELEGLMSPACYVIPSLDGWQSNRVLINLGKDGDSPLLTLAHEAYPGHLYQYVYQRGNEALGVTQRALHYGGYAEGWSQLAEYLIIDNQDVYNSDYALTTYYNGILFNAIVPAIFSIYVNCYDYTLSSIETYLAALGVKDSELAKAYYDMAVEQPYYTFRYAVGYCQLMSMIRDAQTDLGERYDQKEFLKAYLDIGPAYFNLVRERMDVWVDNLMMEEEI